MSSKITTDLAVDDPLVMDANWRFGTTDRRYIDDQILGIQQHLVDSLINGRLGMWYDLDADSESVAAGHAVCLASTAIGTVTRYSTAAIADALSILGVVVVAASPGGKVFVATGGVLPPAITGLGASDPGPVAADGTTGLIERDDAATYYIGTLDNAGWLHIHSYVSSGASGSVPTGTGFRHVTSGVEDAAAVKVDLTDADDVIVPATVGGVVTSSGTALQQAANVSAGSGYITIVSVFGTPVSSTGPIRLASTSGVYARNEADSADIALVSKDSSDTVTVGVGAGAAVLQGAASQGFYNGSAYTLLAYGGQLASLYPIVGSGSAYGVHGVAVMAVPDTAGAHAVASADYALGILRFTGALTADRTVTFPAPATDAEGYAKICKNDCTGSNLVISTGSGADVTMAPGTSAILVFDATEGVWEAVV